jgi:hypothetical protein
MITMQAIVAKHPSAMTKGAVSVFTYRRDGNTLALTQMRTPAGPVSNPATITPARVEQRANSRRSVRDFVTLVRQVAVVLAHLDPTLAPTVSGRVFLIRERATHTLLSQVRTSSSAAPRRQAIEGI